MNRIITDFFSLAIDTNHLDNGRVWWTWDNQTNKPTVLQSKDYYPFGMAHAQPEATEVGLVNAYQYNGSVTGDTKSKKSAGLGIEKIDDHSLGIQHACYRTYDPQIGRMMQIDPMAEDAGLISMSTDNAFINNPIIYSDPNGDKIRISKDFDSRSERREFRQDFRKAKNNLMSNGVGGIIQGLRKNKTKVTIASREGGVQGTDPQTNTIYWDPNLGIETEEGVVLAPTTILNHEAHALQSIED